MQGITLQQQVDTMKVPPTKLLGGRETRVLAVKRAGSLLLQQTLLILLVCALCLGLTPAFAWGDEGSSDAIVGSATLTLVKGVSWSGGVTLMNKTYSFSAGATVEDLFAAAKAAGDIQDYVFNSSGYLDSITTSDGVEVAAALDWSTYWSIYKNNAAAGYDAANPNEGKNIDILADGDAFQFAWCDSVPNIAPTDTQWAALTAAAVEGTGTAGGASVVGSATLTFVKGVSWSGGVTLMNKTYSFSAGATVEDLLAAAKAAGDIQDYAFNSSGYLDSITTSDGVEVAAALDWSTYWSIYKNNAAAGYDAANLNEGKNIDILADGDAFQFAWCDSVPNIAPTDTQWAALTAAAVEGTGTAWGPAVQPMPSDQAVDVSSLNTQQQSIFNTLFTNLAAECAGAGGASERNVSSWKAMEAAAIGQAGIADKDAAIAEAASSYASPDGSNVQRSIIVLTALGIDATQVPSDSGTLNLVERVATLPSAVSAYPTSAAFTLLAYASGPYDVDAAAPNSARALIDKLSASQDAATGAWLAMGKPDVDTTAMIIPALATYLDDVKAKASLDAAVNALISHQQEDGSFGNTNSTAMAIVALCAVGIDPSVVLSNTMPKSDSASNSSTPPLTALLSQSKDDLTGFVVGTGLEEDLINEQGFRALVAYQGLKNTGGAYNIYTQANLGNAGLTQTNLGNAGLTQDDQKITDSKSTTSLATTGDASGVHIGCTAALMLGALTTGVLATRRLHSTDKRRVQLKI